MPNTWWWYSHSAGLLQLLPLLDGCAVTSKYYYPLLPRERARIETCHLVGIRYIQGLLCSFPAKPDAGTWSFAAGNLEFGEFGNLEIWESTSKCKIQGQGHAPVIITSSLLPPLSVVPQGSIPVCSPPFLIRPPRGPSSPNLSQLSLVPNVPKWKFFVVRR
jgi:hypothetical protein